MARGDLQDIARALSEKHKLSVKDAEGFLTAFFDTLNEGLDSDKQVKVKSLGTFKVIDVKERESVDVNTGERIRIEGRSKITFTPDSVMKDLVNKPFAQFETVVLNDGVDFSDIDVSESVQDEEQVEAEAEAEKVVEAPVEAETETEETVEAPVEVEAEAEETVEAPVEAIAEERIEPEEVEEENVEEPKGNGIKNTVLVLLSIIAIGVVMFCLGYYFGQKNTEKRMEAQVEEPYETPAPEPLAADSINEAKDSIGTTVAPDSVVTPNAEEASDRQEMPEKVEKAENTQVAKEEPKHDAGLSLKTASKMVQTGAYTIVGTETTVTLRKGQTLKTVSRAHLGEGMECYVLVHNGKAGFKEGDKIKIPKLKMKKIKR